MMIKVRILKFLAISLLAIPALCHVMAMQGENPAWDEIRTAIEKGDAYRLSGYFSHTVTLSVPGHKGSYSSRQARSILQTFFNEHPAAAFHVKNTGQTAGSSQYYLGSYTSKDRVVYSFYMLFSVEGKKSQITQITFEAG